MTPRVVFDCVIFLQALVSRRGPAAACLNAVEGGPATLVTSVAVDDEVRDVLNRHWIQRKFPTITPERVVDFLARVGRIAVPVPVVPHVFTLTRDPKDSKYLNLAVAAGAEFVVSRDNDLLDLMTASDADALAFRAAYPAIRVLDPAAFLQVIGTAP